MLFFKNIDTGRVHAFFSEEKGKMEFYNRSKKGENITLPWLDERESTRDKLWKLLTLFEKENITGKEFIQKLNWLTQEQVDDIEFVLNQINNSIEEAMQWVKTDVKVQARIEEVKLDALEQILWIMGERK